MRQKEETKTFYQQVYSISLEDMIDVWVESFHPLGTVLVICDAGNYFPLLQDCGILCSQLNGYNNKFLTVELLGVDEAKNIDIMPVHKNGKMILDNIEP